MKQSGEYRLAAPREAVWRALNDPEILARCIEGCEAMERTGDNAFQARVKAKVGPVSALFTADIALADLDPPKSYAITGSVKGGAAGFGRGTAKVALSDADGGTVLAYEVEGSVGGKLAQVGQRLIDAASRKMADDFFARFAQIVAPEASEKTPAPAAPKAGRAGLALIIIAGLALVFLAWIFLERGLPAPF